MKRLFLGIILILAILSFGCQDSSVSDIENTTRPSNSVKEKQSLTITEAQDKLNLYLQESEKFDNSDWGLEPLKDEPSEISNHSAFLFECRFKEDVPDVGGRLITSFAVTTDGSKIYTITPSDEDWTLEFDYNKNDHSIQSSPEEKAEAAPVPIVLAKADIKTITPIEAGFDTGDHYLTVYGKDYYSLDESRLRSGVIGILKNNEKIGEYYFNVGGGDFLMEDRYYFVHASVSKEDGMHMELNLFDTETGEKSIVLSEPSMNMYSYASQLNKDTLAFFYNGVKNNEQCQKIMTYQISTKELKTVYEVIGSEWRSDTNSSKNIWAMTTADEKIYLLQYQLINKKMTAFITCLDKDGNVIKETEMTNLSNYDKKENYADEISIVDPYIFIKYYNNGDQPPFAICRVDEKARLIPIEIDSIIYPCRKLTQTPIDDRYMVFDTYPDNVDFERNIYSANVFIFDIVNEEYRLLKFDVSGEVKQILCNPDGDFLITASDSEDSENVTAYTVKYEEWKDVS